MFIKEGGLYVLNPEHYKSLAGILSPLFEDNRKGFIVAATIRESERLSGFLNRAFREIEFSPFHSRLSVEERDKILKRSREREGFHYIVAVRALDEGVNLPWLSAYVDLNANVSVKQMIHRVGRVLRLHPGKMNSDILFLTDYRDARMAGDLLDLLDSVKRVRFRQGVRKYGRGMFSDLEEGEGDVFNFTREDLLLSRELLEETAKKSFWNKKPKPTFKQAQELFKDAGVYGEKLKGKNLEKLYSAFRKEHPDFNLPSIPDQFYKNKGWKGYKDLFGLEELSRPTFKEAQELFKNAGVYGEKLKGQKDLPKLYKTIRKEHPDFNLPSTPSQVYKNKGWKNYRDLFGLEERSRPTFKQAQELLKDAGVYGEKLKGQKDLPKLYKTIRKEHPDFNLPSHPDRVYRDQGWKGWRDFFGLEERSRPTFKEAQELFKAAGVYGEKLRRKNLSKLYSAFRKDHPDFNLHSNPNQFYKGKGWKGYKDFFGLSWPTLEEAQELFKDAGVYGEKLKGQKDLPKLYKTIRKEHPDFNLPSHPDRVYRDQGWKGWRDFFGLEERSRPTFKEAQELFKAAGVYGEKLRRKNLSKLYSAFRKEHPDFNLHSNPNQFYKGKGWKGYKDFFGLAEKKQRK